MRILLLLWVFMIRLFAICIVAVFIPLSSALGATFSFSSSASLTLTSLTGVSSDFVVQTFPSGIGGAEDTFGGATTNTRSCNGNNFGPDRRGLGFRRIGPVCCCPLRGVVRLFFLEYSAGPWVPYQRSFVGDSKFHIVLRTRDLYERSVHERNFNSSELCQAHPV